MDRQFLTFEHVLYESQAGFRPNTWSRYDLQQVFINLEKTTEWSQIGHSVDKKELGCPPTFPIIIDDFHENNLLVTRKMLRDIFEIVSGVRRGCAWA